MNKTELLGKLSEKTDFTKADSEKFLSAFTETLFEHIDDADGVRLVGFGTFKTADRKARTARNPQTGAEIKVPARKVPVFRPSSTLKDALNK